MTQYPPYPQYPQYPPMYAPPGPSYAPQDAPPNEAEIAAAKVRARRYQIIAGAVIGGLTILALALAAIAPSLTPSGSTPVPAGWQAVYQSNLAAASTKDYQAWDVSKGCSFYSTGLDANGSNGAGGASGSAVCAFAPAKVGGDTSQGFYFEVGLAPAASVSSFQQSALAIGDVSSSSAQGVFFEVDQSGRYLICDSACSPRSGGVYVTGGTAAYHGDAYVANTIAVRVWPNHNEETFYINGQQVADVSVDLGLQPALAAGAPSGSETIFTSARLSTGQ
jgi:hypothetical protein